MSAMKRVKNCIGAARFRRNKIIYKTTGQIYGINEVRNINISLTSLRLFTASKGDLNYSDQLLRLNVC